MLDFIFGWRKASKCKKLIKKVQCRLNLLKNKRSCIVKQLRNDVAQLIKHGHYQIAFDRVDQIYKDERIVDVYEQLTLFCELIYLQFPYIRRNKNCPNDINEAISSLIFASARCGNLPELLQIRKLFTERYGERFETTALELLPGNLVNFQIKENLAIKNVPDEVKYKLLEEIATSVQQNGSSGLEFASEKHHQATNSVNANRVVSTQQTAFSPNGFHFDHPAVDTYPSIIDDADDTKSSSVENVPIVYLDDIAEFQSPLHSAKNGTDQRVFVFRSPVVIVSVVEENPKTYQFSDLSIEHSQHSKNETKVPPRRSRKKSSGHGNQLFVRRIGDLGICRGDYDDTRRAMSMPCKRWTKCVDEENGTVMRSKSLPVEPSPPHVHPKLPDYDELAAMFKALKKEHLQKQE